MMQPDRRELIQWLIYTPRLCKMQWREVVFCQSLVDESQKQRRVIFLNFPL